MVFFLFFCPNQDITPAPTRTPTRTINFSISTPDDHGTSLLPPSHGMCVFDTYIYIHIHVYTYTCIYTYVYIVFVCGVCGLGIASASAALQTSTSEMDVSLISGGGSAFASKPPGSSVGKRRRNHEQFENSWELGLDMSISPH